MPKAARLLPLACTALAFSACTPAHGQEGVELVQLWSEYEAVCNQAGSAMEHAFINSGWQHFDPPAESYIGQILAGTEDAMQITRNAGELPQDFDPQLVFSTFTKQVADQSIYAVLIEAAVPDQSGRRLFDCSLIVPDYAGQISQTTVNELADVEPSDQSSQLMIKFSWEPGLSINQIKTEIAQILPEGTETLERLGLVAARGLTIKSQTLESPNP